MDSDRILVMRDGVVAEFDSPAGLLSAAGSALSGMVREMGRDEEGRMRQLAAAAEGRRPRSFRERLDDGDGGGGGVAACVLVPAVVAV